MAFEENNLDAPKDVSGIPDDAMVTATGLGHKTVVDGSGEGRPGATDHVTVHYSGWTLDGQLFDSSLKRGDPATFPLNGVIKGWTEGLQLMTPGQKTRFWIPAEMAYGNNAGSGRPSGMLVFDVELLSVG